MVALRFELQDGIGELTFTRPDRFNALNENGARQFRREIERVAADAAVRALIITGEGKAFCAGADVSEFAEKMDKDPVAAVKALTGELHPAILAMRGMEKPTVCALNGVAAGGGVGIALACDVIVASENAKVTPAFLNVGLAPDSGTTWFLPRIVGLKRAEAMFLLNEPVDAEEGHRIGLFAKVVNHTALMSTARDTAAALARLSPLTLLRARQLLDMSLENTLEAQLKAERGFNAESAGRKDFVDGVRAFVEKRPPKFSGA
ncbi:MAG: enoyl-CoA hydratase/isomerase family protein [Euryarchaeota archaeon]|nr:enoyl-CoA hydratase/isomerase family protein [Euryarchaeota archaeon]